jgi:LysM repeat protein
MSRKNLLLALMILAISVGLLSPAQPASAHQAQPAALRAVTAYELIAAMNTLRVSYGNPPLIEDPIVNAVAQYTAQVMADNQMSWHIGDVRGRLAAAGYGNGGTVWATENFAVGLTMGLDEIMAAWADPDHMRPAVTPAYCHVGAGVATAANGRIYYVLQAAYVSGQPCGSTSTSGGSGQSSSGGASAGSSGLVSQLIVPVKIATPDADGNVYHIVQAGQSFWSIAIAYQITIADLETWNNLTRDVPLKTGQKLYIPGKNTKGYATPTPKGMIVRSTPDAQGRIIHEVQAYQALYSISQAYGVSVERILALNGLKADWPLQIGQKLLIDPGNITPSPTLSALQKLTPASDGKYYHTVRSGETLSWIASLYELPLQTLLAWNGLNNNSIIRPEQKLLLPVTPPATATPLPEPATPTATLRPTLTPSPLATITETVTETENPSAGVLTGIFIWVILIVLGGALALLAIRKSKT